MSIIAIIRYWVLSLLVGSILLSVLLFVHESILEGAFGEWTLLFGNTVFAIYFSGMFSFPLPLLLIGYERWIRKEPQPPYFYLRIMLALTGCYLILGWLHLGWTEGIRPLYFSAAYAVPGGYFLRKELLKQVPY